MGSGLSSSARVLVTGADIVGYSTAHHLARTGGIDDTTSPARVEVGRRRERPARRRLLCPTIDDGTSPTGSDPVFATTESGTESPTSTSHVRRPRSPIRPSIPR